ncbi:histidine kinase [Sansalvadorimonas sp. 2012CJ34-2]|uniref:Histidine kinase n=1 Tax=Parendozoicomonas callyspongiae TaxID=2942213 RepID=A0ABT0PAF5_9GAMM|nr:histidine kinase [Sansalvadorimonas sp. 2012CJ34-2]MCL6268367.1 histidine kinase [Sansalvadorimonas sp. 2012CJ34-2]
MSVNPITDDNFYLPDFCTPKAVFLLVIAAELLAIVLELAGSGAFSWTQLALTSLFIQWVVLLSAGLLCAIRPSMVSLSPSFTTAICLLVCLTVTSAFTLLAVFLITNMSFVWQEQNELLIRNNIIALIISSLVLRYFYLQKELLRQKQSELTARIQSLQSRIQPHFLFNSMNTIASLISSKPEQAEQAVEDLSDLFRASLDDASILISIGDEIALARQYLGIESLRFGDRLKVTWAVGELSPQTQIPRLCLQPLLENAIVHGIQPDSENGEIIISVTEAENLNLSVSNTLPGIQNKPENNNQIALINISDRLQALFDDKAKLVSRTYEIEDRSWYESRITIPIQQTEMVQSIRRAS